MTARGTLRPLRRRTLTRLCAGLIIVLVLCPFTAPFASYDPNATAIGFFTQDGSALDKTCDKVVSLALPVTVFGLTHVGTTASVLKTNSAADLLLQRSMVLRV